MKFQMLAMGDRFEFDGKTWVKTGPLTAMSEAGEQRMIPRYAPLRPLDAPLATAREKRRVLDETAVMAAFATFYQDCAQRLASAATDETRAEAMRAELAAARERFIAALTHAGKRD